MFSNFIDNRISSVSLAAEHRVEIAKTGADQVTGDVAAFTGEVKEIDGEVEALAKSMPAAPTGTNRVCTWRGQKVGCSSDTTSAATYPGGDAGVTPTWPILQRSARRPHRPRSTSAQEQKAAPEELAAARALDGLARPVPPIGRIDPRACGSLILAKTSSVWLSVLL